MTIVGNFEAKNHLSEFVDGVARGELVVRLLPAQPLDALDQALALAHRIRRSRTDQPSGDGTLMRDIIRGSALMSREAQEADECRRQSRLAAQAHALQPDALEVDLERVMNDALADLDGWIE